jgi:transposase-like protein
MLPNEIYHIARSITRYCKSPKFGAYSAKSNEKFSRRQSLRVKRANKKGACNKGGLARSASYSDQRTQAKEMYQQGMKISQIAKALNVHRNSVNNWIKV